MGRRALAIAAVVAVGVVAAAVWAFWPRGTNEVSSEDAVADFRDRDASTSSPAEADQGGADRDDAPGLPAPGVYTYRAAGREEVKLGPLPAQERPLPETITAVAVGSGNGCFEWALNLFEEHTEETAYCVADDGSLRLEQHVKHQRIGAVSPTATMECDPATLVRPDGSAAELDCELRMSGGPLSIIATLSGAASIGADEQRTVGGAEVTVRPLAIRYDVTGDLTGSWSETSWLTEDHLPVRVERALDLSGPATFSERSELDLLSLDPET